MTFINELAMVRNLELEAELLLRFCYGADNHPRQGEEGVLDGTTIVYHI